MKRDDFQCLIETLEAARSKEQAISALSRYLATIDFEHHAYLAFDGPRPGRGEPFKAGNYPPRWVEEYMGDRLYAIDPLVLSATRSTLPLKWGAGQSLMANLERPVAQIFERASLFGLRSGYTVPIRSSIGQLATMTFASSMESRQFRALLDRRQAELHLGAFHFHDAIQRLSAPSKDAHLTPRERTCLMFSSQGLSGKEIARLLDISPRSVKFHHDNARSKLRAMNLKQAITIAGHMGII